MYILKFTEITYLPYSDCNGDNETVKPPKKNPYLHQPAKDTKFRFSYLNISQAPNTINTSNNSTTTYVIRNIQRSNEKYKKQQRMYLKLAIAGNWGSIFKN